MLTIVAHMFGFVNTSNGCFAYCQLFISRKQIFFSSDTHFLARNCRKIPIFYNKNTSKANPYTEPQEAG